MKVEQLVFAPHPKSLKVYGGSYVINREVVISVVAAWKDELFFASRRLQEAIMDNTQIRCGIVINRHGKSATGVTFQESKAISPEGYTLQIDTDGIRIGFSAPVGAFHAVSTIKQLLRQCGRTLPCLLIEDEPDFAARGLMFDVSRNKVPTMDTLYNLVDMMADMKLNHLQLYMEGFSFAYPSFPEVWETGTPITGEEIIALDRYCRERYIELVPTQNSFGHMNAWLARREFNDLAECPDGYWYNESLFLNAGTLNPLDSRAVELVETMQDDLLPYFSSKLYNVCCDETYELGKGKCKTAADQVGAGRLYLDFLLRISEMAKKRGKRMMFWGDVIIQHPELIKELPDDVIALEWGYEADHPFAEHGAKYREAVIPFYVCPGTSSWNSIVGRTDNMKENMFQAALHGQENGAIGFLNTHWVDVVSLSHFSVIYPGFTYGAALSWNVKNNRDMDLAHVLNVLIFEDCNEAMGRFVLDLGNSYLLERTRVHDGSITGRAFNSSLDDRSALKELTANDFQHIATYAEEQRVRLEGTNMRCSDAALIEREFHNAIDLLVLACKLCELKCKMNDEGFEPEVSTLLEDWIRSAQQVLGNYKPLWLARNRWSHGYENCTSSGLEESAGYIEKMITQCKDKLRSLTLDQ